MTNEKWKMIDGKCLFPSMNLPAAHYPPDVSAA
jgi:hypothetical protein